MKRIEQLKGRIVYDSTRSYVFYGALLISSEQKLQGPYHLEHGKFMLFQLNNL